MCLVVLSWQPDSDCPLLLVANRDEFRERPAEPMHWWPPTAGEAAVLAGKDLKAGGTWLAFNQAGRFALLTNIRPGYVGTQGKVSRGELPLKYTRSKDKDQIEDFHREIKPGLFDYGGFNLLLGDGKRLFWFSSDYPEGAWLTPGIHSLSNHDLNTDWPKAKLARQQMGDFKFQLQQSLDAPILTDTGIVADHRLPRTGVPLEAERMLSAQTIVAGHYGTRCRTLVRQFKNGTMDVREVQLDRSGNLASEQTFRIENL